MQKHRLSFLTTLLVVVITTALFSGRVIACSGNKPETFELFVKQFMANKDFSTTRTLYPHPQIVETEDEVKKGVVTKVADAKYPPLLEFITENQMVFNIEDLKGQRATLHIYAPNTGYSIRYHFIMKRGCWFLKSTHVVSM